VYFVGVLWTAEKVVVSFIFIAPSARTEETYQSLL
jgi:hypothetical protein